MEEQSREIMARPLTAINVREQVNLIQEVMRDVMKDGQHYGTIPGCGKKPTLLKPGAEKLSMTFRLRPIMSNAGDIIMDKSDDGHREITVYCHIMSADGVELATGIGSCSTMEAKYRYRGGEKKLTATPIPKEYWNLKKEGKGDEAQSLIGGPGFGAAKGDAGWVVCELGAKMENPDIADTYNTVLKMAKKRAYVDGILSATAASDIFTQDIEDFPEEMRPVITGEPVVSTPTPAPKPPVAQPQGAPKEASKAKNPISDAQAKRLYAIAKSNGYADADIHQMLEGEIGVTSCRDIEREHYESAVAMFQTKKEA